MTPKRSIRLQLLLLTLAGCLLAGCGGSKTRFEDHLQRGQDYLARGNLDKAGVEFRNAAQIQPKSAAGLYYLGRVAEARGNIREAFGYYQAAIDADTAYAPARAGAGKMLVFGGAGKRALETIAPGLEQHPDNADLLAVRAAAHQQLKDMVAARADAEHAVRVAPTNENAVAVLAALYAEQKDFPRGITLVEGAVAKAPASVDLREVLTNLYLLTGQNAQAEAQMRKIIELKPLDLGPRSQLALFLVRARDLDGAQKVLAEAVQAFAQAKQTDKADQAKLLLVDFVSRQRSREEGERVLRDYVAREPDNLDLRLGLGSLLQRAGAESDALVAYREIVARDGTGAKGLMARNRMAAIEVAQGHNDEASKLVAEVLRKNPRDDDALILRSTLAMRQNDPTAAIADLRAVLRNQPNSIPLQRSLAAAYLAKNEPALAEDALRAALKGAPDDVGTRVELAQVLASTDRLPQGITLLEETVQRAPDNPLARESLLKAYMASGDLTRARDAAEELKKRLPKSPAGYFYAGAIAEQLKHLDESQTNFEGALEREPRRFDILTALARVQIERGAYDSAVARVQAALAENPSSVEIVNLLGGMYFQHKDLDEASDMFSRASALNARLWQPYRNLARVRLARGDPNGALDEYKKALTLAPAEPQLVEEAARLDEQQGRIDEAIAIYEGLYERNRQSQQFAANNLAMLLVTHKTDQSSLDRARDLTSAFTTSTNGTLLDTVGWVKFKRGEYRDALPTLERAAERSPDSKVIRFHLGMAELHMGMRDRARSSLESALTGTNNFQGADEAKSALATLKIRA